MAASTLGTLATLILNLESNPIASMIPETICSASAGEEKNGRLVELVLRSLVVESLTIVCLLVRFCDQVMVHKHRKLRRRMAGFFIGNMGLFSSLKLTLILIRE